MKSVTVLSLVWLVVEVAEGATRAGHYTGAVVEYRPVDGGGLQTAREVTIRS